MNGHLPRMIGPYEVIDEIAEGGMGIVLKCREPALDRIIAVKLLTDTGEYENVVARFEREARITAQLRHPNVAHVYAVGEDEGRHFIAMEYVDGRTLEEIIDRGGKLPPDKALTIIEQAARALSAAADLGLVHRDVKPANVMVNHKGEVKIVDFGLACRVASNPHGNITAVNQVLGTPDFLSPEQAQNQDLDFRSDMYSLGATLYYALAGQPPFVHDDPIATIVDHVRLNVPDVRLVSPEVSDDLVDIVDRLCQKRPEDRYESYAELLEDIRRVRQGQLASIDPARATRRRRRRRHITPSPEGKVRTRVLGLLLLLALSLLAFQNRESLYPREPSIPPILQLLPATSGAFDAAGKEGLPRGWVMEGTNTVVDVIREGEGAGRISFARVGPLDPFVGKWRSTLGCGARVTSDLTGKRLILTFRYRIHGAGRIAVGITEEVGGATSPGVILTGAGDYALASWMNATVIHDFVGGADVTSLRITLEVSGDGGTLVDVDSMMLNAF